MAAVVTLEGQQYKIRHPWGVWGLALITGGIYGLVWYYKINDEARRYLRDESIKPALSVLAFIPGILLLYIPPLVSMFRTGERAGRMQERAGVEERVSAALCVIALLVLSLHLPYVQSNLNRMWKRASGSMV